MINIINMINKIKNLTEAILLTHNISNLNIIENKKDNWKPRLIVSYLNNDEITINGKDEIQKFLNKLIK